MSHRRLTAVCTAIAAVALTPVLAAAQSTNTTALPRTPWGAPDLQGVWDFRSITPSIFFGRRASSWDKATRTCVSSNASPGCLHRR